MIKRLTAITLLLCLLTCSLLTLVSCGDDGYEPVESTAEERRVIMRLTVNGRTYDVKYELYRALFLNYKAQVDGGDASVWSGPDKAAYVERINNIITDRVCEIYSAFALCDELDIDLDSSSVDEQIDEYIRHSVEGGDASGVPQCVQNLGEPSLPETDIT